MYINPVRQKCSHVVCILEGGISPTNNKGVWGIFQADLGSGIGSPYKLPPVPVSGTFLLKRLSEINC